MDFWVVAITHKPQFFRRAESVGLGVENNQDARQLLYICNVIHVETFPLDPDYSV